MVMRSSIGVATTAEGDRHVLRVSGDLDLATAPELVAAGEAVASSGARIEMDLTDVTYIDSSGLRALILVQRAAEKAGGTAVVTAASDLIDRVISTSGLSEMLRRPGV